MTCYCIGQYCTQPTSNKIGSYRDDDNYGGNSIATEDYDEDYDSVVSSSHNNDSNLSQKLSSCEAKEGARCFSAVTQVEDIISGQFRPER